VLVLDASTPPGDETRRLIDELRAPAIIALNKIDIGSRLRVPDDERFPFVETSALASGGAEPLRVAILEALGAGAADRDTPAIGNIRHLHLVGEARAALGRARESLAAGATEELVLTEITSARYALEEITGQRAPEDLLHHIFSRFCVGK
jgi:tRNA modification GTPase